MVLVLKKLFLGPQSLPIFLCLILLSFLLVLFRMKSLEVDYKTGEVKKEITRIASVNKDLKAKRAKLLGVDNLRALASKYNLKEPKQNQIIVVP